MSDDLRYIPTHTLDATSGNIQSFIAENRSYMWEMWGRLIPYLIVLYVLEVLITIIYFKDNMEIYEEGYLPSIFSFAFTYFTSIFVISWHRLVIEGTRMPVLPFKLTRNELLFVGCFFLIDAVMANLFLLFHYFYPSLIDDVDGLDYYQFFLFLVFCFVSTAAVYRISFIFPARAAGVTLSLFDSIRLTRGTFFKFVFAMVVCSFRLFCLMLVVTLISLFFVQMVFPFLLMIFKNEESVLAMVVFLTSLMTLYFHPKFLVIGVTALSNYYMYAMEQEERGDDGV